ncbi:MAG: chemotaxis response regulator protein-glutamate methylesterase [Methylohalobius crimeensis]
MTVKVLVVDDSAFMRRRIAEILEEDRDIEVVEVARDGAEAVRKAVTVRPDVITMDVEMPVMDGIQAVRQIMRRLPTPILMLSALTRAGAQATLAALEAGAMDFIPKRLEDIHNDRQAAKMVLRHRVRVLGCQVRRYAVPAVNPKVSSPRQEPRSALESQAKQVQLLVIAASTGGPLALQKILPKLPASVRFPILLVQHMPGHFTPSFAERLNQLSAIQVRQAVDGDWLRPGVALLAPGGLQMELTSGKRILIRPGQPGETYKPSADVTFSSVAEHFRGRVLGVVMTGMGMDGTLGAQRLKAARGQIWAQDEASCTIYGMPKAVVEAGVVDQVLSLDTIAGLFGAM